MFVCILYMHEGGRKGRREREKWRKRESGKEWERGGGERERDKEKWKEKGAKVND